MINKQVFAIAAGGSGGHVFPALVIAKTLQKKGHRCIWFAMQDSLAHKTAIQHGIEYFPINTPKLSKSPRFFYGLLMALVQSLKAFRSLKVTGVVAMGAYASFPLALAAKLVRCRLIVHEQNVVMGKANYVLSYVADLLLSGMPAKEGEYVGNPVMTTVKKGKQDSVLIMGGSQGAHFLNAAMPVILSELKITSPIIHIAGREVQAVKMAYQQKGIVANVLEFVPDLSEIYASTQWVVCRAGAMTLTELSQQGLPAIVVPYPHAANQHQEKNAAYYRDRQAVMVVREDLTELKEACYKLYSNRATQKRLANNIQACFFSESNQSIVQRIEALYENISSD